MAYQAVCTLDDIWEGDMSEVEIGDQLILLVWPTGGALRAYQGVCPHQDIPLAEGKFDGRVIMCRAHQWTFSSDSGQGINPSDCSLAEYPVKVENDSVYVETEGVTPFYSHS